jgi:hypothetical protein
MKTKILKKSAIFIGIFLVVIILGLLAMLIIYKLPNGKVRKHVAESINTFKNEGTYPKLDDGFVISRLDNFTDSIILGELYYSNDSQSTITKAMKVYGHHIRGNDPVKFLIDAVENGTTDNISEYTRYWHGYIVIWKVLFAFFNYPQIKMLNYFAQIALVIVVIWLMQKKNLTKFIIPFIISLLLINPMVIHLCLAVSPAFYIIMISLIVVLLFHKTIISKKLYVYLFLVIGMLTSYFDFLTYPIATLGMPLLFLLLLDKSDKYKKIVVCTLAWGFGYAGMWVSKWIIGSLLLKENLFIDALTSVKERSGTEDFNRFDGILKNFGVYSDNIYKIIFGALILYYLIRVLKRVKKLKLSYVKNIIPFLVIACMPIAWYFLASQHSYIHHWFTCRALMVFFFALMSAAEIIIEQTES